MSEIKKEEQSDTMQTQKTSYASCTLCPRACHVDRTAGRRGAAMWMPGSGSHGQLCICGKSHACQAAPDPGQSFFLGCALGCIFCQNREIASGKAGLVISEARLSEIFLELQEKGANNINLVTAGHYVPQVIRHLRVRRARGCGFRSFTIAVAMRRQRPCGSWKG